MRNLFRAEKNPAIILDDGSTSDRPLLAARALGASKRAEEGAVKGEGWGTADGCPVAQWINEDPTL
jgi:hypothetical protein